MRGSSTKYPMTAIRKARKADAAVRIGAEPLTDDQRREGVRLIFGADPVLVMAAMTELSMHPKSKINMDAVLQMRSLIEIHNSTYPPPDRKTRIGDDKQFELEFMWSTEGEERVAIAQFERVDDGKD